MATECLFCELRNQERIIGECDLTITFIDNFPASPGHTLFIPKRHFATYFEATEAELLAIGVAVQKAKLVLDEEFSPDAYNIGINNGQKLRTQEREQEDTTMINYIGRRSLIIFIT